MLTILWLLLTLPVSIPAMIQPIKDTPPAISDSLTVYIFLADQCKISQFYTLELERLFQNYHKNNVGIVGYFPNTISTLERIDSFAITYSLSFPLFEDHEKSMTKKLGATVTPEAIVWDHRTDKMIYRGRIDDSYVRVGKRKLHPQHHDLEDIIADWQLNQSPPAIVETKAIGCFIEL